MRKFLIFTMVLLMSTASFGALTYNAEYYFSNLNEQYDFSRTGNPIYLAINEIDTLTSQLSTTGGNLTITSTGTTTITKALYTREVTIYANSPILVAAQSGGIMVNTAAAGTQTFTLPAAAEGLTYTFCDASTAGGDDLYIQTVGTNTINGGSAGKKYGCTTASHPASVTITAVDGTRWVVTSVAGTWANDDS